MSHGFNTDKGNAMYWEHEININVRNLSSQCKYKYVNNIVGVILKSLFI